jgi:hypothetical protein
LLAVCAATLKLFSPGQAAAGSREAPTLWFACPERDRLRSDRVAEWVDVRLIRLLPEEIFEC